MTYIYYESSELYHHGILGQKWGVRRFQNDDGSLTSEGRRRYLNPDKTLTKEGARAARGAARAYYRAQNRKNSLSTARTETGKRMLQKSYDKNMQRYKEGVKDFGRQNVNQERRKVADFRAKAYRNIHTATSLGATTSAAVAAMTAISIPSPSPIAVNFVAQLGMKQLNTMIDRSANYYSKESKR